MQNRMKTHQLSQKQIYALVEEPEGKMRALDAIVGKYTPHLAGQALPENMVRGTAVVKVTPTAITGKYYG